MTKPGLIRGISTGILKAGPGIRLCSGRALTPIEENLISEIWGFSYSAGIGEVRFASVSYKVEIHDREYRELKINIEKLKKTLQELEEKVKSMPDPPSRITSHIKKLEAILNEYESSPDQNGFYTYQYPLLGLYDLTTKTIKLFIGNIDDEKVNPYDLVPLAQTFVHECFHAYFKAPIYIPKIEEPIVECCTLQFLDLFTYTCSNFDLDFDRALRFVENKKYSLGLSHYGFGAYLYTSKKYDWLQLFSNLVELYKIYDSYFTEVSFYDVANEDKCENILFKILPLFPPVVYKTSHS